MNLENLSNSGQIISEAGVAPYIALGVAALASLYGLARFFLKQDESLRMSISEEMRKQIEKNSNKRQY